MQGSSAVSIKIENSVLAEIVKKYKSAYFEVKENFLTFLDDGGDECVQYESVPRRIEDIPDCIEEGIYDNNEARDFRNECAAHKEEILAAYETVYWDYSSEYPLPESVEDHVGASYIKKMREEFAEENDISDEEIDDEFQAYIDEATRIRRDETFHYKKGTTRSKATEIYDCDYTIID